MLLIIPIHLISSDTNKDQHDNSKTISFNDTINEQEILF